MQDLNEDPDEQFRKAVAQYTLRPADSQWDELSGKIVSIKRPRSLADTIRSKYMKWFMLLAFIILIPVVIVSIVPGIHGNQGIKTKAGDVLVQKNKTEIKYQKTPESSVKLYKTNNIGNTVPLVSGLKETAISRNTNPDKNELDETAKTGNTIPDKNELKQTAIIGNTIPLTNELSVLEFKMMASGSADDNNRSIFVPATKHMTTDLVKSNDLILSPIYTQSVGFPPEKNLALSLNSGNHKNLPLQHLDYPRRQGFYLGLVAGPMLTQVKHQGLNKTGFDFGLLAGYTLSKKFSIETGLMYTKQYFFTSGKYYNEFAGINYATSLDGSRNAFEIPLTLKYNMVRRPGGNFFISAGTSTYIGVDDKVLVHVVVGAPVPPSQRLDYGVTSYLPSYVNISLGYEYKIGKFADIRIEPYFQIPLNTNTGNSFKTESSGGSIQVFNTGIHIGITRFIR
ncbi:MAG TPA: hypothetical protein VII28_13430 [Puia sp.]